MSFYLSEGERDTLKSKQSLVLCLHVCIRVPREVCCNKKTLSSTPDEESKWVLFPFSPLMEGALICSCFFTAGKSVRTYASVHSWLYVCAFVCVCVWLHLCSLHFPAVAHYFSMVIREAMEAVLTNWIQILTYTDNFQSWCFSFYTNYKRQRRPTKGFSVCFYVWYTAQFVLCSVWEL